MSELQKPLHHCSHIVQRALIIIIIIIIIIMVIGYPLPPAALVLDCMLHADSFVLDCMIRAGSHEKTFCFDGDDI